MSVTERDYELISAYLDGELTDAERMDLETRLQTNAELQGELQSLRQTVALIRQLPERPTPRNFTLDSRAFGKPVLPFPLTMTFSALSTAAAILFFVFGGYFLLQAGNLPLMTASAPQQRQMAQSIAPTQAAAIAILPTATALPTQTAPPPTPSAQPSPTMEAALDAQMAQMADTESDETAAAASEPAADQAGGIGLFAATEGMQVPPPGEAQEESLIAAEAPATSGESAANSGVGGGGMATAAAPVLAAPAPTTVAAFKSSNTPETAMQAAPSSEQNAVTETPADGAGTTVANAENEGTVGRADDLVRREAAANVDSRGMIGLGLLAAGALLLVAAILTTIVRQRRLRP